MPANLKPKAWNLKPQMTAAPELWRDLIFFSDIRQLDALDLVNNERATPNDVSAGLSSIGYAIEVEKNASTRVYLRWPSQSLDSSSSYTWFGLINVVDTSSSSDFNTVPFAWDAGGDGFAVSIDTSGNVFIFTNGGNTLGNSTIKVDDQKWHAVVAIFDQVQGRSIVSVDGLDQYDVSYSDTSSGTGNIFAGDYDADERGFGSIALTGVARRRWSKGDRQKFGADPYAMLRPAGF